MPRSTSCDIEEALEAQEIDDGPLENNQRQLENNKVEICEEENLESFLKDEEVDEKFEEKSLKLELHQNQENQNIKSEEAQATPEKAECLESKWRIFGNSDHLSRVKNFDCSALTPDEEGKGFEGLIWFEILTSQGKPQDSLLFQKFSCELFYVYCPSFCGQFFKYISIKSWALTRRWWSVE